jgi:hypothetical protein
LAINRCLEIAAPRIGDFIFEGKRLWLWMVALLAYFIYYMLTVSIIFTPIAFEWAYNPYVGYRDDLDPEVLVLAYYI